jgi:hypothetical protein
MGVFISFCAAGAALYGLLLLAEISGPESKYTIANTRPSTPGARSLGSWGPYLPAALIQKPANRPRVSKHDPVDVAEIKSRETTVVNVKQEDMHAEALAARVPNEPSISSTTVSSKQRARTAKFAPQKPRKLLRKQGWADQRAETNQRRHRFGLFARRFADAW